MKLEINPRGNGACPICVNNDDCRLKRTLSSSLTGVRGSEMEVVIYQCPEFKEKP